MIATLRQRPNMSKTSVIDRVVGARLRAKRISVGLDRAALANRIGVTEQRIDEFENGATRIGADTMLLVCRALHVKAGYFFEPWTKAKRASDAGNLAVAAE
jgi:transcriptional regulator with XRE-family HTH domain